MKRLPSSRYLLIIAVACGSDDGTSQPDASAVDFDRRALLQNVGENVVIPVYERFASDIDTLATAIDGYCAALATADEAARRSDAQSAYSSAMDGWQLAELMLLGPASLDGAGIRDQIYSWPVVSACAVDQDVALLRQDPGAYDISARLPNRRGLYAVEYLLFQDSLASLCAPATVPPGWNELPEADRRAARCAFAAVAVDDLAARAAQLLDAWRPEGGNFAGDLAAAGESGSSFASQTDALNAVFAALFYLDTTTKDQKLAEPAGLLANSCDTQGVPCMAELESTFGNRSKQNVTANLIGFDLLLSGRSIGGEDGLGFDDFLRALDAGELADRMAANIAAAQAALDQLPAGLREALEQMYPAVVDSHARMREVTTPLKNELPGVLGLEIPAEAGGDTD